MKLFNLFVATTVALNLPEGLTEDKDEANSILSSGISGKSFLKTVWGFGKGIGKSYRKGIREENEEIREEPEEEREGPFLSFWN